MTRDLLADRGVRPETFFRHFFYTYGHRNVVRELALFPEWFARPAGPDIRHVRYCGFVFHAEASGDHEQVAEAFIGTHGAPIVFTPGTAVQDVGDFCGVVAETCRLLEAPAIVLSPFAKRFLESAPARQTAGHARAHHHPCRVPRGRPGAVEYLPAVAPGGGEALMGGEEPFAYYGTGDAPWEWRDLR